MTNNEQDKLNLSVTITPAQLKSEYYRHNPGGHFFDRKSLELSGDIMKNFIVRNDDNTWDLFRKNDTHTEHHGTKHNFKAGYIASFSKTNFEFLSDIKKSKYNNSQETSHENDNGNSKKDDYLVKITNEFIDGINNNTAPWMKTWKADEFIRPFNPVTGHEYTGVNSLFLESIGLNKLKSNDPRWMTFNNIRDQKYYLKKGSHGVPISFYNKVPVDKDGKQCEPEDAQKYQSVVKMYIVFNASQMEGIPPYINTHVAEHKLKDAQVIESAENILRNSKAKIFNDQIDSNFYSPTHDEIHLTSKHTFERLSQYYCTALHELSHWTGHKSRLDRDQSGHKGTDLYAQEELRAEISSYMICKDLRLDFDPQNSISYVAGWNKVLSNNPAEIQKACFDANQIKDYVNKHCNCNTLNNTKDITVTEDKSHKKGKSI